MVTDEEIVRAAILNWVSDPATMRAADDAFSRLLAQQARYRAIEEAAKKVLEEQIVILEGSALDALAAALSAREGDAT